VIIETALANELDLTLAALEDLQSREGLALRSMNSEALDQLSSEKEQLAKRVQELRGRGALHARHREPLERIRRQGSLNQLLLVHARDVVRTILSQATGTSFDPFPGNRRTTSQEGLRLNVRG
jgi:uncharacterized protein YicC (UPF0701 family)